MDVSRVPWQQAGSFLKSHTKRIFCSLCSAVTSSPLVQSDHVSGSCHGFPNAGVKGQLLVPFDMFPSDRLERQMRGSCLDTVVFTGFRLYQPVPAFIAVFRSSSALFFPPYKNHLTPTFTRRKPGADLFTEPKRGSHGARPGPDPSVHITLLHIHEHPAVSPLSKQEGHSLITLSCGISRHMCRPLYYHQGRSGVEPRFCPQIILVSL